jgi:hypothetical protein
MTSSSVVSVPARNRAVEPAAVSALLARVRAATAARSDPEPQDLRLLVNHYLAVLVDRAPGRSVEVRVPPFSAVQAVPGGRHARGTPPAVVETDALTWIALATGELQWSEAVHTGAVQSSGERSDLSPYLPLEGPPHRGEPYARPGD